MPIYAFECLIVEFAFDYVETICKVNYILSEV